MPPPSPQPSFIPRETPRGPAHREGRGLADLLALLSIVVFVASAALAIGVFLYEQYLGVSSKSKLEQLDRAKAAFEPSLIHELTRLNDRMNAAGEILGAHLAPSAFFRMLEETTIANVGFTTLALTPSDNQRITLTMEGLAQSVNSIALQADLFSKGGVVTSPIFSNINRQVEGVRFSLTAFLNPGALNYAQIAQSIGAAAAIVPPEADTSPFGTPDATPPQTVTPQSVSPATRPPSPPPAAGQGID